MVGSITQSSNESFSSSWPTIAVNGKTGDWVGDVVTAFRLRVAGGVPLRLVVISGFYLSLLRMLLATEDQCDAYVLFSMVIPRFVKDNST
jgi:hypothetical protein